MVSKSQIELDNVYAIMYDEIAKLEKMHNLANKRGAYNEACEYYAQSAAIKHLIDRIANEAVKEN